MSWADIKLAHGGLQAAVLAGDPIEVPWGEFQEQVLKSAASPPYHLRAILERLETIRGARDRAEIAIFDHGCGGALTVLYLAALGYKNIHGIDVESSNCPIWNNVTRDLLGQNGDRFWRYDGQKIPVNTDSMDLLISQQVLEHVNDDSIDSYYREGARILKPGGIAMHSVPHRLVPFDSHTNTWFLHCFLPKGIWLRVLRRIGRWNETAELGLFLRWPWVHRRYLEKHFASYENTTPERLSRRVDYAYYDGNSRLRVLIEQLCNIPVVGRIFVSMLGVAMMMDTVAVAGPGKSDS